jgi:hypothetical protein
MTLKEAQDDITSDWVKVYRSITGTSTLEISTTDDE